MEKLTSRGFSWYIFMTTLMGIFTIFLSLFSTVSTAHAEATLIGTYDFDNNLNDSLGNTTLTTLSTNNTSGYSTSVGASDPTYWYWTSSDTHGGGFYIDIPQDLLSSSDYSIGLRFVYNDLDTGYNKIIDYQNRTSDNGFYFNGRKVMFYPGTGTGTKTINPGDILDMVVTRNGITKLFSVYFVVNGVLTKEFEYTDTNNYSVATVVNSKVRFGFFDDDTAFSGSEATSDGKVYSIKLWNGAVGESSVTAAMEPKYLVSFNDNVDGVSIAMPPVQEVENAAKVIKPTDPVRTNYSFGGWYTTTDLTVPWNFDTDTVSNNRTLYAKWMIHSYTVSFLSGSHGSIFGSATQTISYGGNTTSITAVADSGYYFAAWSDSSTQNPRTISGVDSNITITANFAATNIDSPVSTTVASPSPNTSTSHSGCSDSKPLFIPDLFQINANTDSAKIFFTPIDYSDYYISFSTNPDAEMHGELITLSRDGVQSENIYLLMPSTTYYVKVRGQNGCMPGDWSNIMKMKTNSQIYYKKSFPKKYNISKKIDIQLPLEIDEIESVPETVISTQTPVSKKKCFLWWCW